MAKLIKVFGLWLNPDNVALLIEEQNGCAVMFNFGDGETISGKTPDQVANEINDLIDDDDD